MSAPGATPWRRWSGAEGQGPEVVVLRDEIEAGLEAAERDVRLRQSWSRSGPIDDAGAEGTDAAYADAFRDAGLDLDALEPAEFARRLQAAARGGGDRALGLPRRLGGRAPRGEASRRRLAEADGGGAAGRPGPVSRPLARSSWPRTASRRPRRSRPWPPPPRRPSCRRRRPSCWARPWRTSARPRPPWPCSARGRPPPRRRLGQLRPGRVPWTGCGRRPATRRCGTTRRPAPSGPRRPTSWPTCSSGWAAATRPNRSSAT